MAVHNRSLHLLNLPDVVVHRIMDYTTFVDMCRLRLTSRETNLWVAPYFPGRTILRAAMNPDVSSTFESVLKITENLDLEIGKLYIKNRSGRDCGIYDDPLVPQFLEVYGPGVRKLKMNYYYLDHPAQFAFLQGLPNITELRIEVIDAVGERCSYANPSNKPYKKLELPSFFQGLKWLIINTVRIGTMLDTDFWYAMITSCPRLNHLKYPRVWCRLNVPGVNVTRKWDCFKTLITQQRAQFKENEGCWLTSIDLKNLDDPQDIQFAGFDLPFFVEFIKDKKVQLLNLHAEYLSVLSSAIPAECYPWYNCIGSLMSYHISVCVLPLDGLEKFSAPSLVEATSSLDWAVPDSDWKNLKSIRLHVDVPPEESRFKNHRIQEMTDFLFFADGREDNVTELKVSFDIELVQIQMPSHILSAQNIANGLTSLKKLSLIYWNPVNRAFLKLWEGLPCLEELHLEGCPSLGNVAFIGENLEAPAFLNLTRLVKLRLLGMEMMPKITDRCFKDVFRHLKLKEFEMQCNEPLMNVSKAGIEWLLQGDFSRTIQRFGYRSWSSVHISPSEMRSIKAQFKSLLF